MVVEYIGGQMSVTETPIVTNHYLTPGEKNGVGSEQSHLRFDMLSEQLEAGETDVTWLLRSVAQGNFPQSQNDYERTMWSIVYHPEEKTASFCFNENFDHCYRLALDTKYSWLVR